MSEYTVPDELTQSERDLIVTHFKDLKSRGVERTRFFDFNLPGKPPLFIKRGSSILAEASTQSFFYTLALRDPSAPRIPKVFAAFRQDKYSFFVMEKVEAPTLKSANIPEKEAVKRVASAIKWLFDQMRFVPDSVFGRISFETKACVWHTFFKDHEAPLPYVNSEALFKYVLQAFSRCPNGAKLADSISAEFSTEFMEGLSIYHSDIVMDNFLFDAETECLWMIDFLHVGVLPKVFQIFPFFNTGDKFANAVGRELGYQPSKFANQMAKASCMLYMTGGAARLNRDMWGNKVT